MPLALVLAMLSLVVSACGDGDHGSQPAATAPSATASPVADVKSPTDADLIAAARQSLAKMGAEETPTRVRVWHAPLRTISRALRPSQPPPAGADGARPSAVVLIEGDFELDEAPSPPGADVPMARAVAIAMDAQTGKGLAISALPRVPPSLRILGAPDRAR